MSLNYEKTSGKRHDGESFWAAYADLYLMLTTVFLTLYVTASLRVGTSAVQKEMQAKKLTEEVADLKAQNEVYSALKDDFLEKKASDEEAKVYKQLMDKLSLLQDEAKEEKNELRRRATDNEEKEMALNKYQQIVRNIINANMLAKSSLQSRDKVIETKTQRIAKLDQQVTDQTEKIQQNELELLSKQNELAEQQQTLAEQDKMLRERAEQVDDLKKQVDERKQQIEANNQQIEATNTALDKKISELKATQAKAKTSKAKLQAAIQKAESESAAKIDGLQKENKEAQSELGDTAGELARAKGALSSAKDALAKGEAEKERLEGELAATGDRLRGEMDAMKQGFADDMAAKEKAFKDGLAKEKLSGEGRAAKEKAFRAAADKRAKELEGALGQLGDKLKDNEDKLKKADAAEKKYKDFITGLEKEKGDLEGDLKKTKDQLRDKRKIAQAIEDAFKKSGIKASVDPRSGDVTVNFGEYFDTGKSQLKDGMQKEIKKLMPVYAKSLLGSDEVAEKIASIDIVGFASPTYKGKYVDPDSLSLDDRAAVQYNLDLSYNRAKTIFNFVFDTNEMKFTHQREMLPLVKVTGRSYLAEGARGRDVKNGLPMKEYCAKYDCDKDQKVIIKFNLKD